MKLSKKYFTLLAASAFMFLLPLQKLSAQEALKSYEEEYYDFLSLQGKSERNYLNYRTLSDSVWEIDENNPWQNKQMRSLFTLFELKNPKSNYFLDGIYLGLTTEIYGPEWFNSYNTEYPFGVNDGAFWQGRGYNTSMTAGARVEGFGFELTIKPQVSFSQNLEYEIMASTRGDGFGSYYANCDAPQRFGDSSFWTYDWGDSEIRWTWRAFTIGFGTQSVWLGPNYLYPLMLSNNAATFPKLDIGIRKTPVTIPWINYYLGDFELRFMLGRLSESDYFDTDDSNNHNQYVLWAASYAPSFIPGLTLGVNKVCISNSGDDSWFSYLNPFYAQNKVAKKYGAYGEDQKISFTADYLLEKVGMEFYSEIGVDDYLDSGLDFYEYARYPFHTMSYTVGLQQCITISESKNLYGKINFEWNNTEPSQDYQMWGTYNFATHSQIIQGYTNRGQFLGSGIGYGGNSQHLSFTLYSPHGYDRFFIGRNNPDNAYIFGKCTTTDTATAAGKYFTAFKANFYLGAETMWFVWKGFTLDASFAYNLVINPTYSPGYSYSGYFGKTLVDCYREKSYLNNFNFRLGLKYTF